MVNVYAEMVQTYIMATAFNVYIQQYGMVIIVKVTLMHV